MHYVTEYEKALHYSQQVHGDNLDHASHINYIASTINTHLPSQDHLPSLVFADKLEESSDKGHNAVSHVIRRAVEHDQEEIAKHAEKVKNGEATPHLSLSVNATSPYLRTSTQDPVEGVPFANASHNRYFNPHQLSLSVSYLSPTTREKTNGRQDAITYHHFFPVEEGMKLLADMKHFPQAQESWDSVTANLERKD